MYTERLGIMSAWKFCIVIFCSLRWATFLEPQHIFLLKFTALLKSNILLELSKQIIFSAMFSCIRPLRKPQPRSHQWNVSSKGMWPGSTWVWFGRACAKKTWLSSSTNSVLIYFFLQLFSIIYRPMRSATLLVSELWGTWTGLAGSGSGEEGFGLREFWQAAASEKVWWWAVMTMPGSDCGKRLYRSILLLESTGGLRTTLEMAVKKACCGSRKGKGADW